jgi:hypothetical protein
MIRAISAKIGIETTIFHGCSDLSSAGWMLDGARVAVAVAPGLPLVSGELSSSSEELQAAMSKARTHSSRGRVYRGRCWFRLRKRLH